MYIMPSVFMVEASGQDIVKFIRFSIYHREWIQPDGLPSRPYACTPFASFAHTVQSVLMLMAHQSNIMLCDTCLNSSTPDNYFITAFSFFHSLRYVLAPFYRGREGEEKKRVVHEIILHV